MKKVLITGIIRESSWRAGVKKFRSSLRASVPLRLSLALFMVGLAAAALAYIYLPPLPARITTPGSRVIDYADGSPMTVFLSPDEKWRIPVRIAEVDPDYLTALFAREDQRFYYHPGVDPLAIGRSLVINLMARRMVTGGSTISMQLAKLCEPRPRSLSAKLREAGQAFRFEARMAKTEILERYLELLPFGGNIEGIESASLAFFGHRADSLSEAEIAFLLAVPQNPGSRRPCPQNRKRLATGVERVSRMLVKKGVWTEAQAESAMQAPLPLQARPFPRDALHAADYIAARTSAARVRSTIRRDVQHQAESALARYRDEFAMMGIFNAAAVVLGPEGEVAAAVGNFDYWDAEHGGQVAGFAAPRSPGSAAKPFIYATAIDQGLVLPDYLSADIPRRFGEYAPINYDRRFRGLIRLEEALSFSLNLPFIELLDKVGVARMMDLMRRGGVSTLSDEPGRYGLSLAVGGCELRLDELTSLYGALNHGGETRPLAWTREEVAAEKPSRNTRLFSPGAAWLTRQALRRRDRPDFPGRPGVSAPTGIFWKTGTSAHHRDAWALGGAGPWTAGVWAGNFDARPSSYIIGGDRAAPALFDLLSGLDRGARSLDPPTPDLVMIETCAFSGRPAGRFCPERRRAWALRDHLPAGLCPYHVEYEIDSASGLRVNPICRGSRETVKRPMVVLPASVRRWVADQTLSAAAPPAWSEDCEAAGAGDAPSILSPQDRSIFLLVPGRSADEQEIPLEADAGAETDSLHWFVDGKLLASGPADERAWLTPTPGRHEVRVVDAQGRGDMVEIEVMVR